jgi:hypothetical protein
MSTSGYSGTPLPKKLGIKEESSVTVLNDPCDAATLLSPLPNRARLGAELHGADLVLLFTRSRSELLDRVGELGEAIYPDRALWIAWPKKAPGVPSDVTEDVVREIALPLGLVDTKVCAIDATWSGLRLVWRRELRATSEAPHGGGAD